MPEWVKIVVSAVVGMIAGIVAEPLKQHLLLKLKKRRIRKALTKELWYVHNLCLGLLDTAKEPPRIAKKTIMIGMFNDLRMKAFEHFYLYEKEAIFQIDDSESLVSAFEHLDYMREKFAGGNEDFGHAVCFFALTAQNELEKRGYHLRKFPMYADADEAIDIINKVEDSLGPG